MAIEVRIPPHEIPQMPICSVRTHGSFLSLSLIHIYSLVTLHHGREIAAKLAMRAFFALTAGQEKAAEGELPLLVYNPHPYPVTTVVSCEFQPARQNWDGTFSLSLIHI